MSLMKILAGSGGGAPATYIEDVFSTYLYTGNGSTQTINNGIDLAGKGGMVWIKARDGGAQWHRLFDTNRGSNFSLVSNDTTAQINDSNLLSSFGSSGFNLGSDGTGNVNSSGRLYGSWTFRKQPKFFDVVTFTSTSSTNQRIPHSLGSVPGCIFVRATSGGSAWYTYHTALGRNKYLQLQDTVAASTETNFWGTSDPTSTDFGINGNSAFLPGTSCVAYIFAHNAGGFGLTGTDNVISCGSYTGTGANGNAVTLGYEPQWIIVKNTTAGSGDSWWMMDSMRGLPVRPTNSTTLRANVADAELGPSAMGANILSPTATGFEANGSSSATNGSGQTYIYIAIRRGPMKTPTSGASVFTSVAYTGTSATNALTGFGFTPDASFGKERNGANDPFVVDRLRGRAQGLYPNATSSEVTTTTTTNDLISFDMNGITAGAPQQLGINRSGINNVLWNFRRAPGFFDEVCYTGTGSNGQQISHNLGVTPELVIVKCRSTSPTVWPVLLTFVPRSPADGSRLILNAADAYGPANDYFTNSSGSYSNATCVSSTFFSVGSSASSGASGSTYVAYLFASCPGVSKVGSYTGTGAAQTINCGFTAGARFVRIKRIDSTGDWYVWDTARGIVSGNDPYLLLNSTAAEVTTTDYISPQSVGFGLTASAPAALNASGGTFLYLAIA